MKHSQLTAIDLIRDFGKLWRQLASAYFIYAFVAFAILGPLLTLTFRFGLSLTGASALKDQDIVLFALHPVGLVASVILIALSVTVFALQYAALMTVGFASSHGINTGAVAALRFTAYRSWSVLNLAVRVVGWTLAIAAPFLVVGALICLVLMSKFDINFYLKQRPTEFWIALISTAVLLSAMLIVLVIKFAGWAFALPMLLFDNVPAAQSLTKSNQTTTGHRRVIAVWLFVWLLFTILLSTLSAALVNWIGNLLVSIAGEALAALIMAVGVTLVLSTIFYFVVSFIGAATICLIVVGLYRGAGQGESAESIGMLTDKAPGQTWAPLKNDRRIVLYGLGALVIAAVAGWFVLGSLRLTDHVAIHAHRGASLVAPENTLAAVQRAISDGTDWVEIDVYEIADGQVVVIHDSDLKRVGGIDMQIGTSTLDQLKTIDVGSWFSPEFQNERVPTLQQVLEMCRGKIGVNIELKYHGGESGLEQKVANIVDTYQMAANVVIMSLKYDGLKAMRKVQPSFRIGLLKSVSVGAVSQFDVDFFAVNAGFVSKSFIDRSHRNGRDVLVWTVNDAVTMSTLISQGVDGIITDDPGLAVEVLRHRAALSTPERLLLELATFFGHKPRIAEQ